MKGEPTFVHVRTIIVFGIQRCTSACRDVDVAREKKIFGFDFDPTKKVYIPEVYHESFFT